MQLFQHLGIAQAHIAACRAADWYGPATVHPDLVALLTLVCPSRMDPRSLVPLTSRLLVVADDQGPAAEPVRQLLTHVPGATSLILRDYTSLMRSDVIADHTAAIGTALWEFLQRIEQRHPIPVVRFPEGEVAGLSYRVRGAPPLVLLPLELAPSQWEPLLTTLSARYGTITLGGVSWARSLSWKSVVAQASWATCAVCWRRCRCSRARASSTSGAALASSPAGWHSRQGEPTVSWGWTSTPIYSARRQPSRGGKDCGR